MTNILVTLMKIREGAKRLRAKFQGAQPDERILAYIEKGCTEIIDYLDETKEVIGSTTTLQPLPALYEHEGIVAFELYRKNKENLKVETVTILNEYIKAFA